MTMHARGVSGQLKSAVTNFFCLCYCGQATSPTLAFNYRAGQNRSIWTSGNIRIESQQPGTKRLHAEGPMRPTLAAGLPHRPTLGNPGARFFVTEGGR